MGFGDKRNEIDRKKLLYYILAGMLAGVGNAGLFGARKLQVAGLPMKKVFKDPAITKEFMTAADPIFNVGVGGGAHGALSIMQDFYPGKKDKVAANDQGLEKLAREECLSLVCRELEKRKSPPLPVEMSAMLEGW